MFGSLISAIPTPFDQDNRISTFSLEHLLRNQAEMGVDAVVVAGSTGEGSSLTMEEKRYLFELSLLLRPKKLKVIANIGSNNTAHSIDSIHQVDGLNLDGYLCVVPYYVKPTQEGMYQHFKALSQATEKPILIYNVPSRCVVSISSETTLRLAADCPNIVGIKHASADMEFIRRVKKENPSFLVYTGDDKSLLPALHAGADGIISVASNVYGKEMREIIDLFHHGIENESLIDFLETISDLLSLESNPIPLKYLMSKFDVNYQNLRLPLTPLSEQNRGLIDSLVPTKPR